MKIKQLAKVVISVCSFPEISPRYMNPITPEIFKAIEPKKYLEKFLVGGVRADGRTTSCRSLFEVRTNVIESSLSSASVRIGDSMVIATIKAGIFSVPEGILLVGDQAQGQINVSCDYSLCCLGERRLAQLEGSRISKRIESVVNTVVDRSQLDVQFVTSDEDQTNKAKPVWDLAIDLLVVRDDGSILDAALVAATTALSNLKLTKINRETMKAVSDEVIPLELKTVPMGVSFCMYKDSFLIDPTRDEEDVLPRIWLVVDSNKKNVLSFYGPESPRNPSYDSMPGFSPLSIVRSLFPLITPDIINTRGTVVKQ
jgi:exosome complex RNA-binding protein Rrp42 (RNase PH superfamily)